MDKADAGRNGDSRADTDLGSRICTIGPLREEAIRLTRLRNLLLRPVVRREAIVTHPVNAYELVEQALTQRPSATMIVRPFPTEVPRHIFQRQRSTSNHMLPIAVAT
jgi:hypothetical protein